MATKIDSVSSREKLKVRRDPYWHRIEKGRYVGYRKMVSGNAGSWVARAMDDSTGKQSFKALGDFGDIPGNERFDAAAKAAREWFAHLDHGGSKTAITVGEACERYAQKLRDAGNTEGAKDAEGRYRRWVHSNKQFASTQVTKLTPGGVGDWRKAMVKTETVHQDKTKKTGKKRTPSTVNRDMAAVKAALNLALEDGYATTDAAWKVKLKPIKLEDNRRKNYLSPDQRRALIAACEADLATLITGMCLLPLRPGAVAALKVGDFDKRSGELVIKKDKHGAGRTIALPQSTAKYFAQQSEGKLPAAPLLARAGGQFWNKDSWKYRFKDAVTAAKLPAKTVAYDLRHSTITDLLSEHKLDTLTVALLSGTSIRMIEKHYGHLLNDRAAVALGKLAL